MTKSELEKELDKQTKLRIDAEILVEKLDIQNQGLLDRVEELTKTKADLLGDLVQYRTATFRLHESNAALLTLINKHKV